MLRSRHLYAALLAAAALAAAAVADVGWRGADAEPPAVASPADAA